MIDISLNDPHLEENVKAIMSLKKRGLFEDSYIQELYNRQLEKDSLDKKADIRDAYYKQLEKYKEKNL